MAIARIALLQFHFQKPKVATIAIALIFFSHNFGLSHCRVLDVGVSQTKGHDDLSCLSSGLRKPCYSLQYALKAWGNLITYNATTLKIAVIDAKYVLQEKISIVQPNDSIAIYITSEMVLSVIQCITPEAGIVIGSQIVPEVGYAKNIHFSNLAFQNCGSSFAAAVLVWGGGNIAFSNCIFRDNKNAGLNTFDSSITVENCIFVNNTGNVRDESVKFDPGLTSSGGALSIMFFQGVKLSATIRNTTFERNSALVNNSEFHVAPSSNISRFYKGGGGLLVAFIEEAKHSSVNIRNCSFKNNSATYGGGVFLLGSGLSHNNTVQFDGGSLSYNFGAQAGGAITTTLWDKASKMEVVLKNLMVKENRGRRGAGVNGFFMSYIDKSHNSMLKLENVEFLSNYGYSSRAIRFATALPLGVHLPLVPQIVNCKIIKHVHLNSTPTYTSPLTSHRVDVIFKGHNVFQGNHGVGAAHFENTILYIDGKVEFLQNSAYRGGALELISSQIKLYSGSELVFIGNRATGLGGAMMVRTFKASEMIHQYNTDCFLSYSDRHLPPSKWNTSVSFINNTAQLKGAAIMVSSLISCVWTEEYPHHSYHRALRWNNKFFFQGNCLHYTDNQPVCGHNYDIATDTTSFLSDIDESNLVKLSPGENITLDIKGVDELNHSVYTITSLSHPGNLLMKNTMHVLSPLTNSNLPFMYSVASKEKYRELTDKVDNATVTVADVFSTLKNEFSFKVRPVPCLPGLKFHNGRCVCDKSLPGILRCSNGHQLFLKEGYWAGLINGKLVTYFCPSKYCSCQKSNGLPGCKYSQSNPDLQCANQRRGILCGQCLPHLSVGLRSFQCLKCDQSGWIFAIVVLVVIILCVLVIWLNVGISNDLRGPLFVFQMLPYIFNPNDQVERVVLFLADMFNFGGPLVYFFHTCVIKGMNNLYQVALGYVMPFITLLVFAVFYFLSANYFIRLKFRRHSPLQAFWLIVLFVYTYLVQTTFLIQNCPKLGNKFVFFYDGNIECYKGDHLVMMLMSVVVLVFFVIPPPVVVVLLTRGVWKVDPQYVGTLTNGLRRGCLWWWAVDLGRRVFVVVTYVFIPNWNAKQVWMVLVCVFILALHSNMHPYKSSRTNAVEAVYLALLCTLAALQFRQDDDVRNTAIATLLTLMTCHSFLLTMYKCYKFLKKRMKSSSCVRCKTRYASTDETRIDPEVQEQRDTFDAIFSNSNEGNSDNHESLH